VIHGRFVAILFAHHGDVLIPGGVAEPERAARVDGVTIRQGSEFKYSVPPLPISSAPMPMCAERMEAARAAHAAFAILDDAPHENAAERECDQNSVMWENAKRVSPGGASPEQQPLFPRPSRE